MFTIDTHAALEHLLLTLALVLPRILGCLTVLPFSSRKVLTSTIVRNGFFLSLALVLVPMQYQILQGMNSLSWGMAIIILAKELFLGMVIGLMVAVPFFAAHSMGFLIDNQRGATLASTLNPLSGEQTSPLGILLEQVVIVLFFASGTILMFLKMLYMSYLHWPILDLSINLSLNRARYFLEQLDFLMMITVVLASPIMVGMFISELSFALVNRFTPALNVFILSMPIKSAVAVVLLIVYMKNFDGYLGEHMQTMDEIFQQLQGVLFG